MPLESASHINQLVASNPDGAVDTKSTLDDHIRLIKFALRNDLPNIGGQVSASDVELSYVKGVTSPIQTQLSNLTSSDNAKMPLTGGTFNGPPIWTTAPTSAGHLANKTYVDGAYSAAATAQSAANNAQTTANNATTAAGTAQTTALGIIPAGTRMPFNQTAAPTGWTKDTSGALNDSIMRIVTGTVGSGGANGFSAYNAVTSTASYTLQIADIPSHSHGLGSGARSLSGSTFFGSTGGNMGVLSSTDTAGGGGGHSHGVTRNILYNDFIIATKN